MEVVTDDKTKKIVVNPGYERWLVPDQQLLGYLVNSMTKEEVLAQVTT